MARVCATVTNDGSVGDRKEEMVGEKPAVFFWGDNKLWVGGNAGGPGDSVLAGTGEKARSTGSLFIIIGLGVGLGS